MIPDDIVENESKWQRNIRMNIKNLPNAADTPPPTAQK